MNFRDLDIKISYKSVGENSLTSFINPLLSCTKVYRRSVGYFTSSALDFISEGILSLARNENSKIMLCTSPKLNDEDIRAIKAGYEARKLVIKQSILELETSLNDISDQNAEVLYMLIKEGILDIKVVWKENGMYHDKLAVLDDYDGNVVAFVGSSNETGSGYNENYEKIRVYKSWTDTEGRIEDETREFLSIWDNNNEFLEVYDFNEAFKKKIIQRINNSSKTKPIKYKMRSYQIEAKNNWIKNDHKGFFVMATGTGKTITSLYAIKELIENNKVFTIIAVPYKHLVTQWYDDVKEFFPNANIVYIYSEVKNPENKIYSNYIAAKENYKPLIVITTIKSFFIDRYKIIYDQIEFDKLLIVDEAHNFINRISDELSLQYKYKLGLSATPVFGNDVAKTESLINWFGGKVIDFPIEKAIGKYLVDYEYHPIFINASKDDEDSFNKYTQLMLSAVDSINGVIIDEEQKKKQVGGNSRFGCWVCTVVSKDKSLSSFINKGEEWLIPLRDYRDWLYSIRDNESMRMRRRHNGTIYFSKVLHDEDGSIVIPAKGDRKKIIIKKYELKYIDNDNTEWYLFEGPSCEDDAKKYIKENSINLSNGENPHILIKGIDDEYRQLGAGPFTIEARKEMLTRLLKLQKHIGEKYELIKKEELLEIRKLWFKYGVWEDNVSKIYFNIFGKELNLTSDDIKLFDADDYIELEKLCTNDNVNFDLVKNVYNLEKKYMGYNNRSELAKNLRKLLSQEFIHVEGGDGSNEN